MTSTTPGPLRELIGGWKRRLVEWPRRIQMRRERFEVPQGEPALLGATDHTRARGSIVSGGLVKLAPLEAAFPANRERFNLLYMISSARPSIPDEWMRWARRGGARVVWNQNGVAYPAWAGDRVEAINEAMASLMEMADLVIYQSEFCRLSCERWVGVPRAETVTIINPVDTERFRPPQLSVPAPPVRVLSAGSHQQDYRVFRAIEALDLLRRGGVDAVLEIAGRLQFPEAHPRVDALVDRLGVRDQVVLSGPYDRETAPEVFARNHVLLHPQYKDACPSVVLEALAAGLPVVGTESGGIPELVGPAGVLLPVPDSWDAVPPIEATSLAEALDQVIRDRDALGLQARERARSEFDTRRFVDRHAQVFHQILQA